MAKTLELFMIALQARPSEQVAVVELTFCPRKGEMLEIPSTVSSYKTSTWRVRSVTHVDGGVTFLSCDPLVCEERNEDEEFRKLIGFEEAGNSWPAG